jgi:hypothetical protein
MAKRRYPNRLYAGVARIMVAARHRPNDDQVECLNDLTLDLANFFAARDPGFKREAFEAACALDWTRERVQ